MSIRLRLTLLYSAILTLTLIAFGALLYARQVQDTLNIEKQFLIGMGERLADAPAGAAGATSGRAHIQLHRTVPDTAQPRRAGDPGSADTGQCAPAPEQRGAGSRTGR